MSDPQKHIIHTQIMELSLSSQEGTLQWQEKLSELLAGEVNDLLDHYLSRYSRPDLLYRIDTLELSLGSIPNINFAESFLQKLEEQLSRQMVNELRKAEQKAIRAHQEFPPYLEALLYFLRTGVLPWWTDQSSSEPLEVYLKKLLLHHPNLLRKHLPTSLAQLNYRKRLTQHIKVEDRLELGAFLLLDENKEWLAKVHQQVLNLFKNKTPPTQISAIFWEAIWLNVAWADGQILHKSVLLQSLQTAFKQQLPKHDADFRQMLAQQMEGTLPDAIRIDFTSTSAKAVVDNKEVIDIRSKQKASLPENLFIDNAGIILLGTFLPRLFDMLGLLEDQSFKREADQQRAIQVLHYLTSGEENPPEYITPLLKVLCGIELNKPLQEGLLLTTTDKEECALFLESIIAHAPVLNEMSIDGFRGTFLLRNGILSSRDGHWLVQVERQSYDIIMEQFPWSFQLLKLPWLERLVFVEW